MKMYCSTIFLFVCVYVKFGSGASYCTFDKLEQPVTAEFCDNSKCLPLSADELENLGNQDYKVYTWTKGNGLVTGFCRSNYRWTISPSETEANLNITYRTGKNCTEERTVIQNYTAETDPATGELKLLKFKQGENEWDFCYPFFISGGPVAPRYCRKLPYASPGSEYVGFMYVFEPAAGDCQRDKINAYLKTIDVYWEEIGVEC